jgi:endonuclease/exonuclease/phosphatase family metal-dependent hydrolase
VEAEFVVWNMALGSPGSPAHRDWRRHELAWRWLRESHPRAVLLLQECSPPGWAFTEWNLLGVRAAQWGSLVIVPRDVAATELQVDDPALDRLVTVARLSSPAPLTATSVHCRASTLPDGVTSDEQAALEGYSCYHQDLVFARLAACLTDDWIVGGDFNMSRNFDARSTMPGWTDAFCQRAHDQGWIEVRPEEGELPTWHGHGLGSGQDQLDHVFTSRSIADHGVSLSIEMTPIERNLSDHAPLVCRIG